MQLNLSNLPSCHRPKRKSYRRFGGARGLMILSQHLLICKETTPMVLKAISYDNTADT